MAEILATLDDIKAELPNDVAEATDENTELLQITIARIIRGYLSRVIDGPSLMGWQNPEITPEIVRTIAGKLIAAQHYFNNTANQSTTIDQDSFAQKRYDEAMALLNGIIDGTIVITDVIVTPTEGITDLDFFPIDDTDRAFTMGMDL